MAWTLRRTCLLVVVAGIALTVAWHLGAYRRGILMAHLDHACGHYEVKAHGYVDGSTFEYGRLLYTNYGVAQNIFGGCCVDSTTVEYEDGYNSVSMRLLNEMHGKNIFAECEAASRPRQQTRRSER